MKQASMSKHDCRAERRELLRGRPESRRSFSRKAGFSDFPATSLCSMMAADVTVTAGESLIPPDLTT